MHGCQHHNQQRGRGQGAIHWVCSDCGATITAKDWKDEQARKVGEHGGLGFYGGGGASPGLSPAARVDVTPVAPYGWMRIERPIGPIEPTEEEMRAAKVDPARPLAAQAVMTARFGLLYFDGERWRQP